MLPNRAGHQLLRKLSRIDIFIFLLKYIGRITPEIRATGRQLDQATESNPKLNTFNETMDVETQSKAVTSANKPNSLCSPLPTRTIKLLCWASLRQCPTVRIAKMLGVSDVAIGKRCKRLGIEKPGRGYWSKFNR